jgi:hypothetical protein
MLNPKIQCKRERLSLSNGHLLKTDKKGWKVVLHQALFAAMLAG